MDPVELFARRYIAKKPWLPVTGLELREYLTAFGQELMQALARGKIAAELADESRPVQ